ncbi:MAG: hypothetical protein MUF04_08905 [Akkermansiaceae bacterium]|nr:hypothetical protein [Akkermansiaceae bacterium]
MRAAPLLAQEASYFAASARISSLRWRSIRVLENAERGKATAGAKHLAGHEFRGSECLHSNPKFRERTAPVRRGWQRIATRRQQARGGDSGTGVASDEQVGV